MANHAAIVFKEQGTVFYCRNELDFKTTQVSIWLCCNLSYILCFVRAIDITDIISPFTFYFFISITLPKTDIIINMKVLLFKTFSNKTWSLLIWTWINYRAIYNFQYLILVFCILHKCHLMRVLENIFLSKKDNFEDSMSSLCFEIA